MSNKTPQNKPLILAMNEAEQALVETINGIINSGVPCSCLELIFDKYHRQIKDGANRELAHAKAEFAHKADEPTEENKEGTVQNGS